MNNKILKLLQGVINKRNKDIPILLNAKVEAGQVMVTDMDNYLVVNNVALNDGVYAINDTKEALFLDKTKIESESESERDLPSISFESDGVLVEFNSLFAEKLQKSLHAHSKEKTRYYLNGSFVDFANNCIVATDGHRLFKGELNLNCNLKGVIISTKACKILLECFKFFGEFSLDVTASKCKAFNNQFCLVFKTIDGTFPDYNRVIPEGVDYKPLNVEPLKTLVKSWAFKDRAKAVKLVDGKVFADVVELGSFSYPFEFEVGYCGKYALDIPQSKNNNLLAYQESNTSPLKMVQGSDLYILMPMRV